MTVAVYIVIKLIGFADQLPVKTQRRDTTGHRYRVSDRYRCYLSLTTFITRQSVGKTVKVVTIRRFRRSISSFFSRINPFQRTHSVDSSSPRDLFGNDYSLLEQIAMATSGPPVSTIPAICGLDVGSENSYIAVARAGGIEILLNEYSQRSTPAYVGFGQNQRELGVSAKLKQAMNLSNTCFAPNRLIGKQMKELTEEFPFAVEQTANGEIAVRVWHNGEEHVFTAVQVMAMLLTKLKQVSSNAIDCVLNCPNYFTDSERRALMDAALIAGLNPIKIIPDTTAIALYYGFYRAPVAGQDTTIAAFVTIGNSSTQCSVVLFNHKENNMKVLAVEYDRDCGGKHFDEILANHFIAEQKLKLNKRSRFRLIAECEKLKKQMSANSNDLPINVECLYDEKDFSARMDRILFEQLAQPVFQKINDVFVRAFNSANDKFNTDTGGKLGDFRVDVCEIVGGTSRIPAIKRMSKTIFGVDVTTTLNADEAVSRGCALQSAILAPTYKVARQLQILDFAPFQIDFRYWTSMDGNESDAKAVRSLFPRGHPIPFTKQVSINCQSLPMIAAFDYVNDANQIVPIGEYKIYSERNDVSIQKNKLQFRLRLDPNGVAVIHSVSVTIDAKKNGPNDSQSDDTDTSSNQNSAQPMETDDSPAPPPADNNENSTNNKEQQDGSDQKADDKKSKKPKTETIYLQVEPIWVRGKLTDTEIQKFREIESNLILADKNWKEKTDAKNALEEYIYEWRDKLEGGGYDPFVEADDKTVFMTDLSAGEQWLYEQEDNGVVHSKSVYEERLQKMKDSYSQGILYRKREFETRPSLMEQLGRHLQQSRKMVETQEEVEKELIKKLETQIEEKQKWLEASHAAFNALRTTHNPTITCDEIRKQTDELDVIVRQIYNDRHRRSEEKKRQAEAAAKAAANPPPPTPSNNGDQKAADETKSQTTGAADEPQMEVDGDIHPTI
ncbi:unnamed protein product [Medioppia subpectinata]|uniref:Uncharacterized protein n=1 Tax=Medioppia subpectinata TaxID=1979941 RepID=A0A7R9KJI3_9ACAR|nr:unnamed protein product [Medioppia subpectinata]CAG2104651.1 unnamed protein product [Medioppia subpectinata]